MGYYSSKECFCPLHLPFPNKPLFSLPPLQTCVLSLPLMSNQSVLAVTSSSSCLPSFLPAPLYKLGFHPFHSLYPLCPLQCSCWNFPLIWQPVKKKKYLKKIIIKNKQTQHSVAFAVRQLKSRPMSLPISFQKPKPLSHVHIHTHHANSFNTLRRLQVRDTRAEKESCCLVWSRNVFYFLFCNLLSNFIIRNLNSCFARVNLFSPLSMSGIRGKSRWSYEIWIGVTFSPTMHLKASSTCPRTPGPDDTTLCHQLGAIWNRCDCAGPSWEARARLGFVTFQIWWS